METCKEEMYSVTPATLTYSLKGGVDEALTVPDLVDGLLFLPCKPALVVQRILFEEKANLVARSEEVIVPDVIVVARCELRLSDNSDMSGSSS